MLRDTPSKGWTAGAVTQDSLLSRRQTVWLGARVTFAQTGIIGFDGQIELEALRLDGLPEDAPAILYGCPAVPAATRHIAVEQTWNLASLGPGAVELFDVTVPGARQGDLVSASLVSSTRFIDITAAVWSNNVIRVAARNISGAAFDLAPALLSIQITKRRIP